MKIVAVSMRIDYIDPREEIRDAIDQKLINFISLAGFIPVLVPNILFYNNNSNKNNSSLDNWLKKTKVEAIILSGGNNIGDYPQRDKTELNLINYAKEEEIPLLGICRGMQMLAYWSGIELSPVKGHVGKRLKLFGEIKHEVNCFHEFIIKSCPANFFVIAKCKKGTIQAIKHKYLNWEGWMWHPEREQTFNDYDITRLRSLFN